MPKKTIVAKALITAGAAVVTAVGSCAGFFQTLNINGGSSFLFRSNDLGNDGCDEQDGYCNHRDDEQASKNFRYSRTAPRIALMG